MIPIPNNTSPAVDSRTVTSLNKRFTPAVNRDTVEQLNRGPSAQPVSLQAQWQAQPRPAPQPQWQAPPQPVPPRQTPPPAQTPPVYQRPETPPSVYQRPTPPPQARPAPQPVQTAPPRPAPVPPRPAPAPRPAPPPPMPPERPIPVLQHRLQKGQKSNLTGPISRLKVCFGWNVRNPLCDVDASAFLVQDSGKVPGDEWFVFYGQDTSPDRSVSFAVTPNGADREEITVDLQRLDPRIKKVVFVLTIDEAIPKNLNFSMLKDVYVRLLDGATGREIVSFSVAEYYPEVTSMTMGELYLYNGQWKFNPVGNGIHQDLAGQCGVYGVQIS